MIATYFYKMSVVTNLTKKIPHKKLTKFAWCRGNQESRICEYRIACNVVFKATVLLIG